MVKKSLALLLVLALVLGTLAGCGPKQPAAEETPAAEPMVLRYNLGDDVKTLDPQLNSVINAGIIQVNTFEGLMRLDKNDKAIPGMAEKYEISADGLTYTFHLRDAQWSDGQPVKAQDFEYAWKRGLDPNTASEYAFQLYYLKNGQKANEGELSIEEVGVKAKDDKTLEVILESPTPYFLELTAFFTLFPVRKDMVEKDPETWSMKPETFIGNGPFKMESYTMGDRIILVKNENYYDKGRVKLDKIEMLMIGEASTGLTAFESGDIDYIDDVPTQEIERLKASEPAFSVAPSLATYFYAFQTEKAAVNDPKVRKALSLAIDRKAITEKILRGGEMPAAGFVPPGLFDAEGKDFRAVGGDYGIDVNAASIDEAKALLTEAGYPDGKGFPELEVMYNTSETHKAIAEAIQEMWKKNLNINVKLANQEWAVFQQTRTEGNFVVARSSWFGDYADPMTFLDLWTSYSGKNNAKWKNAEFDKLIEGAKSTSGQERFNLLYEAEKLMMEDMILMPIYYYVDISLIKDYVKNTRKSILGYIYFDEAYIEK
ncbi:peptide ABC transporter substrate-binding protein [Geosporobacter ferrireducens]|uniref:peptide ABC transporter substrate-binding protein n=1 Tax=Geosporobacter ferrireducens TaxID=1424294 RepID=UPI00139E4931|nr:peptide ABC transporter substrate-binding protein [Geosporobacter ferrireducens]MTI54435.1 peptide ABC transporter substrate-binding protein [Geosporobacter ferrireducens]